MMESNRKVFTYRSGWQIVKAILLLLLGPYWIADVAKHIHDSTVPILFWSAIGFVVVCLMVESILFLLTVPLERVVIEGSRLTFFNWLGRQKLSVDLTEIKEIDKLFNSWRVYTPAGRFHFDNKLKGYLELLLRLKGAGAVVYEVPKAYRPR